MAKELKFINGLNLKLLSKAESNIQHNLISAFYDELDANDDLMSDRKWADMCDIKEIREAFNKFYNLTPKDEEYLD